MPKRNLIDELRARGAEAEHLAESTTYTQKYRVRLAGRPEMGVTRQYMGGWRVSVNRRAYQTYSVPMTLALVMGEPLVDELLTKAQRGALEEVRAAGPAGLRKRSTALRQLASLGFLERLGPDHWRVPAQRDPTNPIGGVD